MFDIAEGVPQGAEEVGVRELHGLGGPSWHHQ